MSKYHKIKLKDDLYLVRDVPVFSFGKKFRVAPTNLKHAILEKLEKNEDLTYLKYINSRIHFFVDENLLHIEDNELSDYILKNTNFIKNEILI